MRHNVKGYSEKGNDKEKKNGENEGTKNNGDTNEKENDEEKKSIETNETDNDEDNSEPFHNAVNKQAKNQLGIIVRNIMGNVLGILTSNLSSQEDEIWNKSEMKTLLQSIYIGIF